MTAKQEGTALLLVCRPSGSYRLAASSRYAKCNRFYGYTAGEPRSPEFIPTFGVELASTSTTEELFALCRGAFSLGSVTQAESAAQRLLRMLGGVLVWTSG